jgi:hypothetical protein
MTVLPGSESLSCGELVCLQHTLVHPIEFLEGWNCDVVYINVLHQRQPYVYCQEDIDVVMEAIEVMKRDPEVYNNVLLKKHHANGHPLPGFYTYKNYDTRIDFYIYEMKGKCLYVMVNKDPISIMVRNTDE